MSNFTNNPKGENQQNNAEAIPSNISSNERNTLAQTNKTLSGAGQNITQERTDDMLAINIQNSSQKTG